MSQLPLHDPPGAPNPERILRRLPEAEREEARAGAGHYVSLENVTARRLRQGA